jgi:hypothetical protein
MGWNDLASNQMVSFIDIQGSNFTLKEGKSPIDTNQCITRDEALDMYNINPVSVAIYSGNQLIPKSSLTGSGQSIVLCYDQNNFITACDYCINPPPPPPTGPFDFKTGFNGFISTIQVQTNGNLIVGGRYTTYRNISTQPLVRLLMNGDVDPTFTVPTIQNGGQQSSIQSAIILGDGIGVWCTGADSLTELVSVFAYFSYAGYIAELGGRIRATNGNSSYGVYGVIAEGVENLEEMNILKSIDCDKIQGYLISKPKRMKDIEI